LNKRPDPPSSRSGKGEPRTPDPGIDGREEERPSTLALRRAPPPEEETAPFYHFYRELTIVTQNVVVQLDVDTHSKAGCLSFCSDLCL
jgi:hypothetical protein